MSNAIESYATIYNNPFILTPLFHVFYESLSPTPKNILFSYLLLPLVLYPESKEFLANSNIRSSLTSLQSKRTLLYGLPERVSEAKKLSNLCMQYAIDLAALELQSDLSVKALDCSLDRAVCPPNSIRAAKNLARLLASSTIPEVYRTLGVKAL